MRVTFLYRSNELNADENNGPRVSSCHDINFDERRSPMKWKKINRIIMKQAIEKQRDFSWIGFKNDDSVNSPTRRPPTIKITRNFAHSADKFRQREEFDNSSDSGCKASRKFISLFKKTNSHSNLAKNRYLKKNLFTLQIDTSDAQMARSPCSKSGKKMPLPLYPNYRKKGKKFLIVDC